MLLESYNNALNIKINKSYRLIGLLSLLHFGSLAVLLVLPWSLSAKIALALAVFAHAVWVWRVLRAWPMQLNLRDNGSVVIGSKKYHVQTARLLSGAVRLGLQPARGRIWTVWLMQDALDAQDFHVLCARIRQGKLPVRGARSH